MELWGFESREWLVGEGFGLMQTPTSRPQNVTVTYQQGDTRVSVENVPIVPDNRLSAEDLAAIRQHRPATINANEDYTALRYEGENRVSTSIIHPEATGTAASGTGAGTTAPGTGTTATTGSGTTASGAGTGTTPPADPIAALTQQVQGLSQQLQTQSAGAQAAQNMAMMGMVANLFQPANYQTANSSWVQTGGLGGFGSAIGGVGFGNASSVNNYSNAGFGSAIGGVGFGGGYAGGFSGIDLTGTNFSIGFFGGDQQGKMRRMDALLNEMVAKIRSGNFNMDDLLPALTVLTLKSKMTLSKAALYMIQTMRAKQQEMAANTERLAHINTGQANEIQRLNFQNQQIMMDQQAVQQSVQSVMGMVEEFSNFLNVIRTRVDRIRQAEMPRA